MGTMDGIDPNGPVMRIHRSSYLRKRLQMAKLGNLRGKPNRKPSAGERTEVQMTRAEYERARKEAMDAQPYGGSDRENDDRHGRNLP